jgi:uncharacterized protein
MGEQSVSVPADDLHAVGEQAASWEQAVRRAEGGETVAVLLRCRRGASSARPAACWPTDATSPTSSLWGLNEVIVDGGPLIAGFDDTDVWHDECSRLLQTLPGPLVVPATVVAEVSYMISRYRFGSAAEAAFLRSFATGDLLVGNLVGNLVDDFERMAQLVEQYADLPLGGSDASVIAIAERRSITTILTTDRRHFAAVRPKHIQAFELLP